MRPYTPYLLPETIQVQNNPAPGEQPGKFMPPPNGLQGPPAPGKAPAGEGGGRGETFGTIIE